MKPFYTGYLKKSPLTLLYLLLYQRIETYRHRRDYSINQGYASLHIIEEIHFLKL